MSDIESIKEKVAKLMALGQDPGANQFEAEAALRQASALMRKHNIELAEIAERSGQKPVYNWRTVLVPASATPTRQTVVWVGQLAAGIARFTDCKAEWKYGSQYGWCIAFSGDSVDVEYAVYLAKHLRDTVRAQSSVYSGGRADRETFRRAMVGRLVQRMSMLARETKEEMKAAAATGSTALVLVDRKIALRDEHFGAMKTRTAGSRQSNYSAAAAGTRAGDKVNFNRPLGHQAKSALPHVGGAP